MNPQPVVVNRVAVFAVGEEGAACFSKAQIETRSSGDSAPTLGETLGGAGSSLKIVAEARPAASAAQAENEAQAKRAHEVFLSVCCGGSSRRDGEFIPPGRIPVTAKCR